MSYQICNMLAPSQYVYVMEYDGGSWVQKGSKIEYTSGDIQLGRGMAFSGDGLTIAVGANMYTNNLVCIWYFSSAYVIDECLLTCQ